MMVPQLSGGWQHYYKKQNDAIGSGKGAVNVFSFACGSLSQ
jgi:hypothetical protein